MNANTDSLDGVDLWFFGGTPGPDDTDEACTLTQPRTTQIDEDDARIPAFAHRCDCSTPIHLSTCASTPRFTPGREDSVVHMHFQA